MIFLPVEKEPDAEIEQPLPDHALEPGALGDGGQQQQWQQKPELVQQNGHQGGNVHVISPRSRYLSLATGHSDWREPGVAPQDWCHPENGVPK